MRKLLTPFICSTILLNGCAGGNIDSARAEAKDLKWLRITRERDMQELWANRSYRELYEELGPPNMKMDVPRYGWPNSEVYIYTVDAGTGCIDAFLVAHKGNEADSIVLNYFCQ